MVNKVNKEEQEAKGGAGIYTAALCKQLYTTKADWRNHVFPEIWDGYNISDIFEEDIDLKLNSLEKEEEHLLNEWRSIVEKFSIESVFTQEEEVLYEKLREKKNCKNSLVCTNTLDLDDFVSKKYRKKDSKKNSIDIDMSTKQSIDTKQYQKSDSITPNFKPDSKTSLIQTLSRTSRSSSLDSKPSKFYYKISQKNIDNNSRQVSHNLAGKVIFRSKKQAKAGEADRLILMKKPKYMYSGKMKIGSRDRR